MLAGNLGRAVVKVSAVAPSIASSRPRPGFSSQHAVEAAYKAGELNQDAVIVVRHSGPAANGMPELHKLMPVLGNLQKAGLGGAGHRWSPLRCLRQNPSRHPRHPGSAARAGPSACSPMATCCGWMPKSGRLDCPDRLSGRTPGRGSTLTLEQRIWGRELFSVMRRAVSERRVRRHPSLTKEELCRTGKVTPAEVFAASPLVPVMVINDLEQALPMAKALGRRHLGVRITLRTPVALEAIALIAKAMPDAMVGAGTVLNCAQFDAAVAPVPASSSPGHDPGLLAYAARSTAPLIPGGHPSEVMQALEAGYDHLQILPGRGERRYQGALRHCCALPQVKFCPTGGIGPKNVADHLALKCVATVGGSWMLPAEAVKSGNWDEVTRLSREAVELVKR